MKVALRVWFVVVVAACDPSDSSSACRAACEHLEQCGLFPNDLGAGVAGASARANCEERCVHSTSETAANLRTCLYESARNLQSRPHGWCEEASCAAAARCIDDRGLAIDREPVRISVVHGIGAHPNCLESDESCGASSRPPVTAQSLCTELLALRVRFSSNGVGLRDTDGNLANYDCETFAAAPRLDLDLPIGTHRVDLELTVFASDDEGPPTTQCWLFWTWAIVPNTCQVVELDVPSRATIDETGLDGPWLMYCPEQRCADGRDDDRDSYVDCDDDDCRASLDCAPRDAGMADAGSPPGG